MIVGIKDAAKLAGVSIIACCAVLVCTMFLNYYLDLAGIKDDITSEQAMVFYEAQEATAQVVCSVSGGCLLITSVIMVLFYIKHYIDTHKKELGILKALGYSNFEIARHFWVFGISVFTGALTGFGGAFLIMPSFYALQNEDNILPETPITFHWALLFWLVLVPTAAFAALSVCYSSRKLKSPPLALLKENIRPPEQKKKTLVFFIFFASFCFSSMTQMSASMKDLSSVMMGIMILLIGAVLACTTLFLAVTTVIRGSTKTIAMMRVFGYSQRKCCRALLGGYRPVSYIGFAAGTVYQYALLRIMVDIIFRDFEGMPAYEFDFPVMLLSLAAFLIIYETVMYCYSEKIKNISLKEIMLEG